MRPGLIHALAIVLLAGCSIDRGAPGVNPPDTRMDGAASEAGADSTPPADTGFGEDAGPCTGAAGCDDGIGCTVDRCTAGVCENIPNDALCSEAAGGRCMGVLGCQYAVCDATTCIPGPCETAECQGNVCVRGAGCASDQQCCGSSCVPLGCNDGNPCTLDSCQAEGCVNEPDVGRPCDDGDPCTESEMCTDTGACTGPLIECPDDGNTCTDAACVDGACTQLHNTRSCNDRNPCTMSDRCMEGVCAGSPVSCGPGRRCVNGGCVECVSHSDCNNTCNSNDCSGCGPTCAPRCQSGTCGCGCP